MNREEQIKELAEAWEALGDGRMSLAESHYWWVQFNRDKGGGHSEVGTLFFGLDSGWKSFDTQDATDCLSILRDVKGEDWDIVMSFEQLEQCISWTPIEANNPIGANTCHNDLQSTISRIHATTLAIKEGR